MPIQLIAMDMDGTLLDSQKRFPAENAQALRAAMDAGIHIALCSGRMSGDLSLFAVEAGLARCHILGLNGGYCTLAPHGKPYAIHYLDAAAVRRAVAVFSGYDVCYGCFHHNTIAVVDDSEASGRKKHWGSHRESTDYQEYLFGMDEAQGQMKKGLNKIVYIDPDTPRREEIHARLLQIPGLVVTSSGPDNLELMPPGVNKGTAVAGLCQKLSVPAENVMTIGDYANDVSMIAFAGFGTAMGNATGEVKAAAKYVTDTNDRCGVAKAVWRYALSGARSNA